MTISFRAYNGLTAGTTTAATWSLPTGHTLNDILLAPLACKAYSVDASSGVWLTDYTLLDNHTNGTTANGIDVGSLRLHTRYRVHDGTESGPTATLSAAPSPRMTAMAAFSKTNAGAWDIIASAADDTDATGTAVSCTPGSTMDINAGDEVVVFVACRSDISLSSTSLTIPGCTLGTLTLRSTTHSTTTGNDGMLRCYSAPVTSGTATGAPTFASTSSASGISDVAATIIRLREPAPPAGITEYWGAAA